MEREAPSRRTFLKTGGACLAGGALLGAGFFLSRRTESATSSGIKSSNTPSRNRENLIEALTGSSSNIAFPPGDYRIDNSGSPAVIRNFEGNLTMEEGARFVFTDASRRGLVFERGRGARFLGVDIAFAKLPKERMIDERGLLFADTTDTFVRDLYINGSAGAGLLFARCVNPSVSYARIENTMADGLHFSNCRDAKARHILTRNTGDDGLAFLNYSGGPDLSGGAASDVTVKDSEARGIAVVGQRDVTIRDFYVYGTKGPGIYCTQEDSYNTRTPSNVRFEDGVVSDAAEAKTGPARSSDIEFQNVRHA